jgi:hypothetical protein
MLLEPPLDTPVLIFEPNTLGSSWYFAIRARVRGAKEPRWKIYAWRDRMAMSIAGAQFQPVDWMPIEPTVN